MLRTTFGENINMAMDAVWSHRFRSALTILGIVVGITTVVTVGSLTTGLRQGIVTFFLEFGPDNIFVNRVSGDPSAPGTLKEQKRKPILPEYAAYIKNAAQYVDDVAVQMFVTSQTSGLITAKVPGFETEQMFLSGFSANSFELQPLALREGRVFTEEEARRLARVVIIGPQVASALFPDGRALDQLITIAGTEYRVIGVTEEAKGGFFGQNGKDQQVIAPFDTLQQRFPTESRILLVAKAKTGYRDDAFEEVRSLLRRIRNTPPGAEDDFALSTADQIVKNLDQILRVVLGVSIALASLGLLVGGIGVMNIMLVSVTERTKEIGVRKAIGARKFDIIVQFLTEAVTLTGLGGALGVVISVLITLLIGALVPALPSSVPVWAIAAGFSVSVGIGIFFGTWPALKAAQLDPVDALRYE